ncbi:ankyrin repeat-containing domain protein [Flagelloscypha sp. PMI_526]|nr:ankyrin repeat-containing domain protein [Flagelloscypha sp. PMI_526]
MAKPTRIHLEKTSFLRFLAAYDFKLSSLAPGSILNVTVRRVVAWTAAAHDYDSTMSPNLTRLICQAAIEADDTSHVVYNPRIDWAGQPAAELIFPSASNEHDLSRNEEVWPLLKRLNGDILAAWGGQLEVARLLVEYGADVNLNDQWFGSALTAAVQGGTIEVTKLLVDKVADVNLLLSRGVYGSAWPQRARRGNLKVVKFLVEKGADANLQLVTGEYGSALAAAAQRGTFEIGIPREKRGGCEYVVESWFIWVSPGSGNAESCGSTEGFTGNSGVPSTERCRCEYALERRRVWVQLAAAAQRGSLEIVKFLVQNGADVNMRLRDGCIDQHWERQRGRCYPGGTVLVESGADVNLPSSEGDYGSALALATARGWPDVAEFLMRMVQPRIIQ